MAVVWPCEQIN